MKPRRPLTFVLPLLLAAGSTFAAPPGKAPDEWLSVPAQFPAGTLTNWLQTAPFASLHAEALAGQVKIYLAPSFPTNATVTLFSSADEAGHWPARDWRATPMTRRGDSWEAAVPVDDVDMPLIYYALAVSPGANQLSPMRRCSPRALGLEAPALPFTPFLEGFEESLESWRCLKASGPETPLQTAALARRGRNSLRVQIPAGQRSAAVATTRVRGWQIGRQGCSGLSLWLRAREDGGQARFTLLAHAGTPGQVVSPAALTATLTAQWQKIELPFAAFPRLPLADVDLFTIEFVGPAGAEFFLDDLQYLHPRRLELE